MNKKKYHFSLLANMILPSTVLLLSVITAIVTGYYCILGNSHDLYMAIIAAITTCGIYGCQIVKLEKSRNGKKKFRFLPLSSLCYP